MAKVYIGIGSNLGNREENIRKAISILSRKCEVIEISSLYETEPIGFKEQSWFLNGVLCIDTTHKPIELLEILQNFEKGLGRIRRIKDGPRIIDLDILFYKDMIIDNRNLIIPHPRLHERRFVLIPLNEIASDLIHPIMEKSVKDLLRNLGGWERWEDTFIQKR